MRRHVRATFAALLVLALPALARGQASGRISGTVTDASGAVVPGASVEAVNRGTGHARAATTGADGFYAIPLLAPGHYDVKAALQGFRATLRQGIRVTVAETSRVDFALQPGDLTESVTVLGDAPLVETGNATLGIVIEEKKIVDLPLNGRNFTQLGTLIPGVVAPPAALGGASGDATPGGFGNVTGGFNVNGQRNQSNNFLLDGAANNDTFNTGFVLRPPPDAIQEFKILTHSYSAEYGRNSGSVVNVVTKSGTNAWHGAAWEFNRNDALEARNFFAAKDAPKPDLRQNQFGATLGGPILESRLFVFGYYEGFRNTRGTTQTNVVLSDAQRRGDFSGGSAIRDPLTGLPFPGNVIPADRLDPIARSLLEEFVPPPNGPGNRYTQSPNVKDDRDQFGVRLDYRPSDRHSLLGRYLHSRTSRFDPFGTSPLVTSVFSPAGNRAEATLEDLLLSDTWQLGPRAINVLRVSWNRIDANPTTTSGRTNDELGWSVANNSPAAVGLPWVTVTGFFTLGDAQQPFAKRKNEVFSIGDDLTLLRGRHSLKLGVDARRDRIELAFINRPNGDFTFSGAYSGSAAADFLMGFPFQFRQAAGDPVLDGESWTFAAYAQDELRLSPRLTLNLGLRYELPRPFYEKNDHLNSFRPGQQSVRFPAAPTNLVYPGDPGVPRGTYETDTDNLAPRLGVVWDPSGKGRTSVRAAWGLFYDTLPGQGDFFQNGTLAPPFQPLTEVNFPTRPSGPAFGDPLAGIAPGNPFPPGLIYIGWGTDFSTPYAHHYNLTVQHQVGERLGFEVGYVGSRGRNLPVFMEVNPGLVAPGQTTRGPRLYPAFSLVRPTFSVARSWYDSLQAAVRLRPWRGLSALASYTWAHAIDHVSGLNIGGESRPILPVDQADPAMIDAALARQKGDALFDVRHRFVLTFAWELPRLEDRGGFAKWVLGGWQVNGIVQAQTGFPMSVTEPNDVALRFLTNVPDQVCDPNDGAARTPEQWFRTDCFARLTLPADAGRNGDAGRNTIRGPGLSRTDLSLFKTFPIAGEHRLQLRIEAFNLFNHPRFGQPGATVGTPVFGVITAAEEGRIVQLGVKYSF